MNNSRWHRFSLRALLLVVTAVGIVCGVWAWEVQEAMRQEVALRNIEALGGVPLRVTMQDGFNYSGGKLPEAKFKWWHEIMGKDYFVYCPLINLRNQSVTADAIRSMIPLIEQIRLKEGLNEAGTSYIALDVSGNPNVDESLLGFLRNRLPQCRVVTYAVNSTSPYSQ